MDNRCKTCGIVSLCMRCANVCHKDHYLSQPVQGQAICQCGLLPHCVIKERPNLRVQCIFFLFKTFPISILIETCFFQFQSHCVFVVLHLPGKTMHPKHGSFVEHVLETNRREFAPVVQKSVIVVTMSSLVGKVIFIVIVMIDLVKFVNA